MSETRRIGTWMTIIAWVGILLLLTWAASIFLETEHNPNQDPRSGIASDGAVEVLLQQNRAGHYLVDGHINHTSVTFLLDTGATNVALDAALANKLGLKRGYEIRAQTANGEVIGYHTLLKRVAVADIELWGVPAIILPELGDEVLLGMSFLKRLTLVQRGETLLLRKE